MNIEEYWGDSLHTIIDPITTQSFSLFSSEGLSLLQQLINSYKYKKQLYKEEYLKEKKKRKLKKHRKKHRTKQQNCKKQNKIKKYKMSYHLTKLMIRNKKKLNQIQYYSSHNSIQEVNESSDSEISNEV